MALTFKKASKAQAKLRMAIDGPAGAGKTYSALRIAAALVPGGRIAVVDTERGSASKYADLFQFDVLELDTFSPNMYVDAIAVAAREKYDVIIVDSLSHAWSGKDGALEKVDSYKDKFGGGWRNVTPMHNALVDAILSAPCHVIATMRTHMEYVLKEVERNGRKVMEPQKVGMKPVQRAGMEYEFDIVGDIDLDNQMTVSKTRCPALTGRNFLRPGEDLAAILSAWLSDGVPVNPTADIPAPTPIVKAVPAPMPVAEIAKASQQVVEASEASASAAVQATKWQERYETADNHDAIAIVDAAIHRAKIGKDDPRRERLLAIRSAAIKRVGELNEARRAAAAQPAQTGDAA